jgi:DNA repair protein RadC
VTSDSDVARIMEPQLGGLQHEECWALYLASSGRVLERMRISQGGVQATVVDCKLIIKRALELLAVQIVLVHNHPSGNSLPSDKDAFFTNELLRELNRIGVKLIDHVVLGDNNYYSFKDKILYELTNNL